MQARQQHHEQKLCVQPATLKTENFPAIQRPAIHVTIIAGFMMKRSNLRSITLKVSDVSEPGVAAQ